MAILPPRMLLESISIDDFPWLCLALLKREISPAVRLVSIQGPDANRDATLEGPCITQRYSWSGRWIFQFKHYRYAGRDAGSRMLTDLRREVEAINEQEDKLDNYVFLTSVPFTGTPGSGLRDRTERLIGSLSDQTGLNIDVWDGLELTSLLLQHRTIAMRFLGGQSSNHDKPEALNKTESQQIFLASRAMLDLKDDSFFAVLNLLLGTDVWVLAPGSNSHLWRLYLSADYTDLIGRLRQLRRELHARRASWADNPERIRAVAWIYLLLSLLLARVGNARLAIRICREIASFQIATDCELEAWRLNVLSLAYGKLDASSHYERATAAATTSAQSCGCLWLARTIELRRLHKLSWAAGESDSLAKIGGFEDDLARAVDVSTGLSPDELEHLRAQYDSYLALHHTWQPNRWDSADRALLSAEHRFRIIGDISELARIWSERGRLTMKRNPADPTASAHLRAGLRRRIRSGERPRVRYDFLWLGQALGHQGWILGSELCMWAVLAIHADLNYNAHVDTAIVRAARSALAEGDHEINSIIKQRRLDEDYLLETLCSITELDPLELTAALDVSRLRYLIRSYAA